MGILINLNGDTPQTILDSRKKASAAMRALDEAMRDSVPHGRNYVDQAEYMRARQIYNILQHAMHEAEKMWTEDAIAAQKAKEKRK